MNPRHAAALALVGWYSVYPVPISLAPKVDEKGRVTLSLDINAVIAFLHAHLIEFKTLT